MNLDDDTDVKINPFWLLLLGGVITLSVVVAILLIVVDGNNAVTPPTANLSGQAAAGKAVFLSAEAGCSNCHPSEGRAGGIGPRLSTTKVSDTAIRNYIRNGYGTMPSNGSLTDEQINEIIEYLHAIRTSN